MVEYTPEGKGRDARRMTESQLAEAFVDGSILESTALAYDRERQLVFELAGRPARMPHDECAAGAAEGAVRDVALLTRVGRPTCFRITALPEETGGTYLLSRRLAQEACQRDYLDALLPGELVTCVVTHLESFGAFCDVGCGISALLPIDCMSVSRIQSPADRVSVSQQLICAVKSRDDRGRLVLTLRELLGTWQENADRFHAGETVVGLVRSVESYGVFIELAPNLAGLAERCEGLRPGQPVSVFIKSILPEKMKIKLVIVNRELAGPLFFAPRYFITEGRLEHWVYSTPGSKKRIETDLGPAAL